MALKGGGNISVPNLFGGAATAGLNKLGAKSIAGALKNADGGLSIGIEAGLVANNTSSQEVKDDTSFSRDQRTNESYNNIVRAASSENFAKSNNIDKSYSDDVRSSYEKQLSSEKAMNVQSDRVNSLTRSLSKIQSMDGSMDRDMFHEVESCLLYTSPSPRDRTRSRMPSSA